MKQCTKCKQQKNKTDFSKGKREKDGLQYWCKDCHKQYRRKYHQEHKEEIRRNARDYREKNPKLCLNCNTMFLPRRKKQNFCSRSCATSYQIRKEKAEGKPAHNWKGGKIKKICIGCNNVFYVWPFKVKEGYGLFCNRECYQEHWREYIGVMAPPTKPEKQFMTLCEKYNMPFKYVGDNQFFIGRKNPDFIHNGGKKICVEIFGRYYHSSLYGRKVSPIRTYVGTKEHYKKYGWECIVIWDNEVNSEELVLSRL